MTKQDSPNQSLRHPITTNQLNLGLGKQRNILKAWIEEVAIEKYRSSGAGVTYLDIQRNWCSDKKKAQRSLKYFHTRKVLFTARDLASQGIYLLGNRNPQAFFPTCIKGEIIENLKKRKRMHMDDMHRITGSLLSQNVNLLQDKKAQTFLAVLLALPFTPPYTNRISDISTILQ